MPALHTLIRPSPFLFNGRQADQEELEVEMPYQDFVDCHDQSKGYHHHHEEGEGSQLSVSIMPQAEVLR